MYDSVGVQKIKDERERQKIEHGYVLAHDKEHDARELSTAAALTLCSHLDFISVETGEIEAWVKRVARRYGHQSYEEALTVAGAMIAAELDRVAYEKRKDVSD